ncbi:hypothetical protein, conserved [Leishmania tarentolae]|uniref:F-box domain-containing protein n=1 Tax=Leishmania tarentolae TaxID=5689 RepID=A0A640KHM1_LEITA|nr:hypothetical protein, conserved [Leishmania tarentolae]
MNSQDGRSLPSSMATAASGSSKATSFLADSSPTSATQNVSRQHSFLDLDDDIFNYICSYVPVSDLLLSVAVASHHMWRRVSANYALWQQLWMRYLVFFYNALIPSTAASAHSASPPAPPTHALWRMTLPDAMGMLHTSTTRPPSHDSIWRLYYFHRSSEVKPCVVQLEKLQIVSESIDDPAAAASPTSYRSPRGLKMANVREELLSFAQACATQTVARNLKHMATPFHPSSVSPSFSARQEGVPQGEAVMHGSTFRLLKQQQRQADRLQRVLHFLLSVSGHRPRFHDPLWEATNNAKMEFLRKTRTCAASTEAKMPKRRNPLSPPSLDAVAAPPSPPWRPRPMSWLDDQETSVKVLLFDDDDDTRSVGDDFSVREERSTLLASIKQSWRIAYASQFYPSMTDGSESERPLPRAPTFTFPISTAAGEGAAPPVPIAARSRWEQATWEQVYHFFRDGSSATIHRIMRMRQQATTQGREGGSDEDDTAIPSSNNPLFDLHLLGYEKRKQVYTAMLDSAIEVPEGIGIFFATCVSESFLRWWCWRKRRHAEARHAPVAPSTSAIQDDHGGLPVRCHIVLKPFSAIQDDVSPPLSLWVVRVVTGDLRHDIRGNEAGSESVTYSSSYSDLTTTTSHIASYRFASSSSVHFSEERGEDNEFSTAEGTRVLETVQTMATDEESHVPTAESSSPAQTQSTPHSPPVALLFPLPHMLTYWFMMHHVSFYSHQVYRHLRGDQELTIAVCSRILSPTGHSAECRLFYSLRCPFLPRMSMKMMFTPGVLPSITMPDKMAERWKNYSYRSSSSSNDSESLSVDAGRTPMSSSVSTDDKPVNSQHIYDLFWTGSGRVEVQFGPTVSRSNMLRLRIALGLPVDFPMGLLWNVVMFASGIGPAILEEHRNSLHLIYGKTLTDVMVDVFGELACFGFGAQSPSWRNDSTAMTPTEREEHVVRIYENNEEVPEAGEQVANGLSPADHGASSTSTSLTSTTSWSQDLDSESSSGESH